MACVSFDPALKKDSKRMLMLVQNGFLFNSSLLFQQLPRSTQQQAVSFRDSTFFPSYKPRVFMEDNEKSDVNSLASSDDLADISVGNLVAPLKRG
jgi:hypothetical protein